jgi:alanine racemase
MAKVLEQAARTGERQCQVAIDRAAIAENTRQLRQIVGPHTRVLGIVKADGYGHGVELAARAMLCGGACQLGVSTVGEGLRLRAAGIDAPILVLGYTSPEHVAQGIGDDLALSVDAIETAVAASHAARALGRAAIVHLKIDTGMHRLGLLPRQVDMFLQAARELPCLDWRGIFTHFATADAPERPELHAQLAVFNSVVSSARRQGWQFPVVHAANSAAALGSSEARFGMVRAGLALYGLPPGAAPLPPGFRPALSFHTRVARVAELPAGSPISYGADYRTSRPSRIATIAVGYADGLRRSPPWRAVLIRGWRAPIVGRICMDYAMVDVTHIPGVAVGDAVTLLGAQGPETIGAEEVARWLGTSVYEVLATIAPGQPRVARRA